MAKKVTPQGNNPKNLHLQSFLVWNGAGRISAMSEEIDRKLDFIYEQGGSVQFVTQSECAAKDDFGNIVFSTTIIIWAAFAA